MSWFTVPDSAVRHVWRDVHGEEHYVGPGFYEESGTPIDEEEGLDMEYVRTEIFNPLAVEAQWEHWGPTPGKKVK